MISSKTLYLTEDRESAVEEGDPKAKFLLVRAGGEISDADAEKYGVKGDKKAQPSAPAEAPDASESASPAPKNREADIKLRKRGGKK